MTRTGPEASDGTMDSRAGRAMAVVLAGNGAQLVLNLATGILTARLLEPEGRGVFASISVLVFLSATLGQIGTPDAAIYYTAKKHEAARGIASTGIVLVVLLSAVTYVVLHFLIPLIFRAQPQSAEDLARVCSLGVGLVMLYQLGIGLANGLHQFGRLAVLQLGQPVIFLLGLVLAAALGRASATTALSAYFAGFLVLVVAVLVPVLVRGQGALRPSLETARRMLGFGVRDQLRVVGDVGNTRLDMAVMPAFLSAAAIGHYSVAVSAASIVILLFGALGHVVGALATSSSAEEGARLVQRTTRMVLVSGFVTALVLGVTAPSLIRIAYGSDFAESVEPLRLLLPGCVLWAAGGILGGGLRAVGRPGAASIAQAFGLVVTVVGLSLLLPRWGIVAAAGTSTLAYTTVFVVLVFLLRRHTAFRWSAVMSPRLLIGDLQWVSGALAARFSRR